MARERASSGITSENTLFVGPRIPDEIRRMIPHLTSIDKALFRKILQGKLPWKYWFEFSCFLIFHRKGLLRISSRLIPDLRARVRFSLGADVKTPFFEYSHQNSGTVPVSGFNISTLYSPTYNDGYGAHAPVLEGQVWTQLKKGTWSTQCLNATLR